MDSLTEVSEASTHFTMACVCSGLGEYLHHRCHRVFPRSHCTRVARSVSLGNWHPDPDQQFFVTAKGIYYRMRRTSVRSAPPEEITLSPQELQPPGSIRGVTGIWEEIRPSYTQACEGITLPLPAWACEDLVLPPLPRSVFGGAREYFYSVATEADVQVKPRRIHRQQLQALSIPGPSGLEMAADRIQFVHLAVAFPAAGSKLWLGCNSRLGHLPSTLVLQNRTPKQSAWETLNADRPGIPTGLAILPAVPLLALTGASDLWCFTGLACLSQMKPERDTGFWN